MSGRLHRLRQVECRVLRVVDRYVHVRNTATVEYDGSMHAAERARAARTPHVSIVGMDSRARPPCGVGARTL